LWRLAGGYWRRGRRRGMVPSCSVLAGEYQLGIIK
jgi:hypothetical protein